MLTINDQHVGGNFLAAIACFKGINFLESDEVRIGDAAERALGVWELFQAIVAARHMTAGHDSACWRAPAHRALGWAE